jgi:hypothetical protein
MIRILLPYFLSVAVIFAACSKTQDTIDTSTIVSTDFNGNLISGTVSDGQWQKKTFSTGEQNLFSGLDTADLSGTTAPDSVVLSSFLFPNPLTTVAQLYFQFSNGYNGQILLKFVVVDNHLNIVDKQSVRIQGVSNSSIPQNPSVSNPIMLSPNIPPGNFRFYYTLSAASDQHFYESWGNIQKTN